MMTFISFTPWPLLFGLTILSYAGFRLRRHGWVYLLALALFGAYLLFALDQLFFPLAVPENWPANLSWEETLANLLGINLIPFNYGSMITGAPGSPPAHLGAILFEIGGNLLLTVPFGLGLCFLTGIRGRRLLLAALTTGLALEGAQLALKLLLGSFVHAIDINDVILNGLGVLIGAGVYQVGRWVVRKIQPSSPSHPYTFGG